MYKFKTTINNTIGTKLFMAQNLTKVDLNQFRTKFKIKKQFKFKNGIFFS